MTFDPMTHEEASELLGVYALDAVDGDERSALEAHLSSCPRCRAEFDVLHEVAGAIGTTVERPPEELWSHIASALPARRDEAEARPMPQLAPVETLPSAPTSGPFRRASTVSAARRRRITRATVGALAAAAAVIAVVLGLSLAHANDRISNLQSAAAKVGTVQSALNTPGNQLVDLRTASDTQVAQVVMLPNGRGYLVSSSLPTLGAGKTYQLWGVVGGRAISLGVLGSNPRGAAFTMAGSRRPSVFGITAEPAGGSVTPTLPMVASATV